MLVSKLDKILEYRGIKQNWLAKKTGVSKTTLSNIVTGRHTPSLEIALKISIVLDIPIESIWVLEEWNPNELE